MVEMRFHFGGNARPVSIPAPNQISEFVGMAIALISASGFPNCELRQDFSRSATSNPIRESIRVVCAKSHRSDGRLQINKFVLAFAQREIGCLANVGEFANLRNCLRVNAIVVLGRRFHHVHPFFNAHIRGRSRCGYFCLGEPTHWVRQRNDQYHQALFHSSFSVMNSALSTTHRCGRPATAVHPIFTVSPGFAIPVARPR